MGSAWGPRAVPTGSPCALRASQHLGHRSAPLPAPRPLRPSSPHSRSLGRRGPAPHVSPRLGPAHNPAPRPSQPPRPAPWPRPQPRLRAPQAALGLAPVPPQPPTSPPTPAARGPAPVSPQPTSPGPDTPTRCGGRSPTGSGAVGRRLGAELATRCRVRTLRRWVWEAAPAGAEAPRGRSPWEPFGWRDAGRGRSGLEGGGPGEAVRTALTGPTPRRRPRPGPAPGGGVGATRSPAPGHVLTDLGPQRFPRLQFRYRRTRRQAARHRPGPGP